MGEQKRPDGAVLFVHRFGDSLNSHVHFHVVVTDGVVSADPDDPERAIFHPAVDVDEEAIRTVRDQLRHRGLRWLVRHDHLDAAAASGAGVRSVGRVERSARAARNGG